MSHPYGPRTGRPPTYAARGMVATPHTLASAAGLRALQRGGSAVDAAISAKAVLCVAYPHMAGLGGDGFWLVYDPRERQIRALNASRPSARAATLDYYPEDGDAAAIPRRRPFAALAVPGAVDGWREMHARFGKLAWEELFAEAIFYAREGVPVSRSLTDWLAQDVPILSEYPTSARVFLPGGKVAREGERLVQEDLAASLERIGRDGARGGFY